MKYRFKIKNKFKCEKLLSFVALKRLLSHFVHQHVCSAKLLEVNSSL